MAADTTFIAVLVALGVVVLLLVVLVAVQGGRRRRAGALEGHAQPLHQGQAHTLPDGGDEVLEFRAHAPQVTQAPVVRTPQRFGPDVVVYDLPAVQPSYRAWEPTPRRGTVAYTFPRPVEKAVYTNDYIRVDAAGTTLKMRTLLAGPDGAAHAPLEGEQATPARPNLTLDDVPEPYRSKLAPQAPAARKASASRRDLSVPATGRAPDGTQFVEQLQERISRPAVPVAAPERAYYDYPGDVHPVEEIEGIGAIYGDKLRAAGVHTTARLCFEDAQALADKVGVPLKTVQQWQAIGELVKVKGIGPQYAEALARSGIDGIAALKRRAASTVTEQVNAYLDSLEVTVVGTKITEARVEGWKKAAEGMKRVRLKEPAQ
jgi:predicted flap endonuclease-1-like 5' DNA nuclease